MFPKRSGRAPPRKAPRPSQQPPPPPPSPIVSYTRFGWIRSRLMAQHLSDHEPITRLPDHAIDKLEEEWWAIVDDIFKKFQQRLRCHECAQIIHDVFDTRKEVENIRRLMDSMDVESIDKSMVEMWDAMLQEIFKLYWEGVNVEHNKKQILKIEKPAWTGLGQPVRPQQNSGRSFHVPAKDQSKAATAENEAPDKTAKDLAKRSQRRVRFQMDDLRPGWVFRQPEIFDSMPDLSKKEANKKGSRGENRKELAKSSQLENPLLAGHEPPPFGLSLFPGGVLDRIRESDWRRGNDNTKRLSEVTRKDVAKSNQPPPKFRSEGGFLIKVNPGAAVPQGPKRKYRESLMGDTKRPKNFPTTTNPPVIPVEVQKHFEASGELSDTLRTTSNNVASAAKEASEVENTIRLPQNASVGENYSITSDIEGQGQTQHNVYISHHSNHEDDEPSPASSTTMVGDRFETDEQCHDNNENLEHPAKETNLHDPAAVSEDNVRTDEPYYNKDEVLERTVIGVKLEDPFIFTLEDTPGLDHPFYKQTSAKHDLQKFDSKPASSVIIQNKETDNKEERTNDDDDWLTEDSEDDHPPDSVAHASASPQPKTDKVNEIKEDEHSSDEDTFIFGQATNQHQTEKAQFQVEVPIDDKAGADNEKMLPLSHKIKAAEELKRYPTRKSSPLRNRAWDRPTWTTPVNLPTKDETNPDKERMLPLSNTIKEEAKQSVEDDINIQNPVIPYSAWKPSSLQYRPWENPSQVAPVDLPTKDETNPEIECMQFFERERKPEKGQRGEANTGEKGEQKTKAKREERDYDLDMYYGDWY